MIAQNPPMPSRVVISTEVANLPGLMDVARRAALNAMTRQRISIKPAKHGARAELVMTPADLAYLYDIAIP